MNAAPSPRIGLVTDSDINRYVLQKLLSEQHYELALSVNSQRLRQYFLKQQDQPEPDVWLVDVSEPVCQQAFDTLLDKTERVVLVSDEPSPALIGDEHERWCKKLIDKLELLASNGERHANSGQQAEHVLLLAASTGGPAAVNEFLAHLAPGLPIAMVYAQHIETHFDNLLAAGADKKSAYPIRLASGEQRLTVGEVLVVPVDYQLRFLPFGLAVKTRKAWTGQFQPAIDQVSAELAELYRKNMSLIIFSGMCNDGEIGARVTKACGGRVWVQNPDSCVSPDMPNAAIATGCVSEQGSPKQLAQALTALYR